MSPTIRVNPARANKGPLVIEVIFEDISNQKQAGDSKSKKNVFPGFELILKANEEQTTAHPAERIRIIYPITQSKVANYTAVREETLKQRLATLESAVAAVRKELEKPSSATQNSISQLSSVVQAAQTDMEGELPESSQEDFILLPAKDNGKTLAESTCIQSKDEIIDGIEHKDYQLPTAEFCPSDVTEGELKTVDFVDATGRIILTRALSDFKSANPAIRANAAKAIAGVHHKLSIRALAAHMKRESSPKVQQECIKALTTLGMREGMEALEYALNNSAVTVRLAAVKGLYNLAGADSALMLTRMFTDEHEDVRRRAATYVGWLGQKEHAVDLLILLDDSSISVRRAAVEALGNLRCRQAVSVLIERLNDPEESVRKAVLGAIETITGNKIDEPFPSDKRSLQDFIAKWRQLWKQQLLD